MTMTRDTYDVTLRRASQISHKLEMVKSSPSARRASKVSIYMAKRSLMREDFEGSERTLVASSLDSNNSSLSNINTPASSSSYYTNSTTDVGGSEKADEDVDEDEVDVDDVGEHEELETDKGLWEKNIHYILLAFGAVFGMRSVLTFPALAMEHGGGAFLLTYIFLTFTVGLPIVYLEVSLGQYARGGVVKTWRILPLARGIGVCSLLLTLVRASYSSTPVVWALYYLYSATLGALPGPRPTSGDISAELDPVNASQVSNITAHYHRQLFNVSHNLFFSSTLEVTDSISSMGHVVPQMIAALLLVWTLVFSLCALGPRLASKISFCFTVVPSILLVVFVVAALAMPGSVVGIQSLLNPRWHHLGNVKPWLDVLDFVLSSLSCGSGVLITLSGQCNFHDNTFRSAVTLTVLSSAMTTVSGCLMFSLLGAESRLAGVKVHQDNMTRLSNVELGFVLLPTVVTDMPATNLWSCLFYLALVLLGLVEASLMVYTFQQGLVEMAHLEKTSPHWRTAILGGLVLVLMTLNIFTTAQNGLYVMRLVQAATRVCTPLICAAQCVAVGWGYGARRFAGRITEMTGRNKSFLWKWLWRWGCPALLSVVVLASLLAVNLLHELPQKDKNKKWLHGLAWSISPLILVPGLAMAVVSFFSVRGTFKQRLKQLRSTPSTWGPGHPEHEPQADLPDYVICHPDPFRPANALAMLTANLYLPNIVNFVSMQSNADKKEIAPPSYLSDVGTVTSSDDDTSLGSPASKSSFFTRCQATVSGLSHVVGLGNVVRFPYLAYRHGGGAFLIAYLTVLVTCGIPLVVMETAIGQFSNLGPITVWRAVPIFKGVGYSMVLVSVVSSVYYSVITSWCTFYLATSLTSMLPWQDCTNTWNTNSCRPNDLLLKLCHAYNETGADNLTEPRDPCWNPEDPSCGQDNLTFTQRCSDVTVPNVNSGQNNGSLSPSHEYFYLAVLKISESWAQPGEMRWQLVACLLLIWIVVTVFLLKCCKPGRKITYLVLLLTCTVLIILLVRASSLAGGHDGLNLLFTPGWSKLIEAHVWRDAVSQVFFSLSLGSGTLIVMGTYNKFSNDLFREAMLVCVIDGAVSLLSSLVIFAVVGAMAHAAGQVTEVAARADLGLAFVALSSAALQLPWPLFWAILVFLVMVFLGVFTCVASMATALTSLMDLLPASLRKQRLWLLLGLCSGSAVLGLPMVIQVGFYVIDVLDTHMSGLPQACIGGLVCAAFSWVYGLGRLCRDIKRMNNSSVGCTWKLFWLIVCPCATAMLVLNSIASLTSGGNDLKHPWWTTAAGLVLWLVLVAPVLGGIVHELCQYKDAGLVERFRRACQPKKEWGTSLHRCTSLIEYYPTVHTHLGLDISREGLNTVADHVDFTTVGVRVPSLSQTTLLPVSPATKRVKKPLDMRHKAILNHAYSNPQCDLSTGSLDKLVKQKRYPVFLTRGEFHDVIIVKRRGKEVVTCDSSTQTEPNWAENKLCRQRSQPAVNVTKPLPRLPRSLSWHQLGGQPAVLEVNMKQLDSAKVTEEKDGPTLPRRRRHGQSMAPNLCLLIAQEEAHPKEDVQQAPPDSTCEAKSRASSQHPPSSGCHVSLKTPSREELAVKCSCCKDGVHVEPSGPAAAVLMSHRQPDIYTRHRSKVRDSGPGVKGGRSKSVDESPGNIHRSYDRYGPSKGVDNASFYGRTRSVSESGRPARSAECRGLYHGVLDRAAKRRGSNVIMEEEDGDSLEDQFDIDSRLQFIQSEAEVSKI